MSDDTKLKHTVAEVIDELEGLVAGLNIPLAPAFHVEQLKVLLPEKVEKLKTAINYDELIYE